MSRFLSIKNKVKEARILALTGIAEAGSGHPGASFSAAEIMGSLYFQIMNVDIATPFFQNRDYFINSKAILLLVTMRRYLYLVPFQKKK